MCRKLHSVFVYLHDPHLFFAALTVYGFMGAQVCTFSKEYTGQIKIVVLLIFQKNVFFFLYYVTLISFNQSDENWNKQYRLIVFIIIHY